MDSTLPDLVSAFHVLVSGSVEDTGLSPLSGTNLSRTMRNR